MWDNKLQILALSLTFSLFVFIGTGVAQKASIPVVEYEPRYNDLNIIRAGDMVNISWNNHTEYEIFRIFFLKQEESVL